MVTEFASSFVLARFILDEKYLKICVSEDLSAVNDKTLIQIKADSSKLPERLEKISEKYEQLLQQPITDGDVLHHIQTIGAKYVKLNIAKTNKFIDNINIRSSCRGSCTRIRATIDKAAGMKLQLTCTPSEPILRREVSPANHSITLLV